MIRILAVLLVVQLAIVAALYWPRPDSAAGNGPLVAELGMDAIETVIVSAGEDDAAGVTLQKRDGNWVLESGLPADAGKVTTLLAALATQDPGYAIARSDSAARRFEVSPESFDRRIELTAGAAGATVYLGSSPSFRKIHARRDGDDGVFVLTLNSYDAPAEENDWLDRGLLAQSDVSRLRFSGFEFTLGEDGWQRNDGGAVAEEAMETLVQGLASLRVSGLAAEGDETAAAAAERLRLGVGAGGGEDSALELTVLENSDEERYYLRSNRYEVLFTTSSYDAERLIEAVESLAGEEAGD